jgi:multidrug efflux pump subunit AcrA (membrane-fusion protein)
MQPVIGTVTRTAGAVNAASRTLLTEVDIPNASHELLPGMFVYVAFVIRPPGTRWRVPATAVVIDDQGTRVVLVAGDGKLHFQPVALGRDFGDTIDVQAGLQGNEAIVKQPTISLEEGQLVRPIAK